jgi:hypothetical protein
MPWLPCFYTRRRRSSQWRKSVEAAPSWPASHAAWPTGHHLAPNRPLQVGGGVEPLFKRARPWSFLPLSSRYTRCVDLSFQYFGSLDFEGCCADHRNRTLLVPVARRQPVVALTMEVLGIGGVPQGTVGARITGRSASRSEVLGGATTAPGSSSTTSLGSPGPFLPGSSDCGGRWRVRPSLQARELLLQSGCSVTC